MQIKIILIEINKNKKDIPNLEFKEISDEFVHKQINKTSVKKVTGRDGISAKLLKLAKPVIAKTITNSVFPDQLRNRPFNLQGGVMFFCFVQKFFFGQHESFFQNLTFGYMAKTLNQTIFFSSTKIRIFFSATLGIRIFF